MSDSDSRNEATRNFGMVWANDYDTYHLVLGYARALLKDHPNMGDLTLGRNVKDYVFALRNGGGWGHPEGIGSPRVRDALQWIDATSHGDVDEYDVAEDVRYGLGVEADPEGDEGGDPNPDPGWHDTTADNLNTSGSIGFSVFEE